VSSVKTDYSRRAATAGRGASIEGIDHIEMYVSNNRQEALFYRTGLGFDSLVPADHVRCDGMVIAVR